MAKPIEVIIRADPEREKAKLIMIGVTILSIIIFIIIYPLVIAVQNFSITGFFATLTDRLTVPQPDSPDYIAYVNAKANNDPDCPIVYKQTEDHDECIEYCSARCVPCRSINPPLEKSGDNPSYCICTCRSN